MLSPSEASEEFRDSVVRCFRTLLSNLIPCSDTSCCCQNTSSRPALLDIGDSKCLTSKHLEHYSEQNECLITFLQSEGAAAAVGHWLSLLLNVCESLVLAMAFMLNTEIFILFTLFLSFTILFLMVFLVPRSQRLRAHEVCGAAPKSG